MKKIVDGISTAVIVILVLLVLILYASSVFGIKTFSVLSGSMEPNIHVGSIIYVKPGAEVEVGDAVTFYDSQGTVVTHRVNTLCDDGKIITKGDANNTADSAIERSQIIGKVIFHIPCLGYCAVWLSTFSGKCFLVCLVAISVALIVISELFFSKENAADDKTKIQKL